MKKLIYLILILTLSLSCVEKKSAEKEISKSQLVRTSKTVTLKFTSGISSIFQDSKGNYWFGDRDTGIWKYDGNTMKNYTNNLGQSHDFVHTIYKDNNDELWFVLTNGNVFKFNGKTFDKQF